MALVTNTGCTPAFYVYSRLLPQPAKAGWSDGSRLWDVSTYPSSFCKAALHVCFASLKGHTIWARQTLKGFLCCEVLALSTQTFQLVQTRSAWQQFLHMSLAQMMHAGFAHGRYSPAAALLSCVHGVCLPGPLPGAVVHCKSHTAELPVTEEESILFHKSRSQRSYPLCRFGAFDSMTPIHVELLPICLWWQQVLAGLHLEATRVQPVKPSQRHAQETHRKHNYDKTADLSDIKTQRYLSLTATWEHLLQKIAHDVDMEDTDFACIFEDDVALHDDLSTTNARKVILHGMDIARSDGVLYMGVCEPECLAETTQWLGNYTFAKCYALCAHAMAVTKAKAVTYMDEMHAAFQHEFKTKGYDSYPQGHVIDQMLLVHARTYNATWAIATNLVDPQTETYGYGSHYGAFIQDKWRHSSSIDTAEALRLSKGY